MYKVLISFLMICGISSAKIDFPKSFIFGTATSSFQIEGGWNASGKTPSYWDILTHEHPDKIKDRSNGDIACDSYHKYKDDVKLLRNLGVDSYRFSLSWPRILPDGYSYYVNPDGIQYYNALIDELLRYNITPMVTLYHWDIPTKFDSMGGWTNAVMADYFAEYADIAFKYFGDRVKMWSTFNEPHSFCPGVYKDRVRAPYLCYHNVLRAHGKVYHLYKNQYGFQQGSIGIVLDAQFYLPLEDNIDDQRAVERVFHYDFHLIADPIFSETGDYSAFIKEYVGSISKSENQTSSKLPTFTPKEIEEIRGSYDYLGLNHYRTQLVGHGKSQIADPPSIDKDLNIITSCEKDWPVSDFGWCQYAPGFYELLMRVKNRYNNPPVYITENGIAVTDFNDYRRIEYYKNYIESVSDAVKDGANILGYYAWSLMDNFEWLAGYTQKFGLFHVDFNDPNRPRTPKPSALWYQQLIQQHKAKHLN